MGGARALIASLGASFSLVAGAALSLLVISFVFAYDGLTGSGYDGVNANAQVVVPDLAATTARVRQQSGRSESAVVIAAAPAAPRVEPVVVTASAAAPAADRAVTIPTVPRPTYLDAPEMARPLPAPLETPAPTGADTRPQDAARTADDQISAAAEQDIAALDLDNVLARRRAC